GSPTARPDKYLWDDAVDGDTYAKTGTAFVMADETGKPWAIFEFIDQGVRNINKIRMMNDTGIRKSIGRMVREFTVLVSTTGTAPEDFTTLLQAEKTNNVETPDIMYDDWMDWEVPATTAKYIKLVIDAPIDPFYDHLGEFEVWFETVLCDAAQSFINALLAQDGTETYEAAITLTLADENGAPVVGKTFHDITFHSIRLGKYNSEEPLYLEDLYTNLTETTPGVYTVTLTSTTPGERKIVASVNGVVVEKTAAGGNDDLIVTFDGALGKRIADAPVQSIPNQFGLLPNFPNPFNPVTTLPYNVARDTHVSLKIYDVAGHEVATLVDGYHNAGTFTRTWNAVGLPSGVYFCRMTAGEFQDVRRMILLK
ncbi:T9SS type A sorting domain-containing protein, partial [candidate division KSB1 bacterium]|nr:T9SS type A sorting domain-containing protein [candidate division KSB1 bacterium]